jgi:hypothetical protein
MKIRQDNDYNFYDWFHYHITILLNQLNQYLGLNISSQTIAKQNKTEDVC